MNFGSDNECPCKAGEPKQGSEEPIEPVTELEAEKSTSKILRDLLAKAEAERDEARADSLRAELAAAREEIAKLRFPPIVVPPEGSPGRQGG